MARSKPDGESPTLIALDWPSTRQLARIGVMVVSLILVAQMALRLQSVLLVVTSSLVLALGLQPALAWFERRKLSRGLGLAAVLGGGALLAGALAAAVVPMLIGQIDDVMAALPGIVDELAARDGAVGAFLRRLDVTAMVGNEEGVVRSLGSAAGMLINIFTVLVLTPYFAYSYPAAKRAVLRLLEREDRREFLHILDQSVDRVAGFIAGNLIVSLFAGVASFVAFRLIGLPYALALAVWVAVTDLVPVVGVFLGAVPVVFVAAVDGTGALVASGVFLLLYQQLENYVIAPKVMNRTVDLSPASVILALMIGGSLAGVLGALLALPTAALVKLIFGQYVLERRIVAVREKSAEVPLTPAPSRTGLVRPLP